MNIELVELLVYLGFLIGAYKIVYLTQSDKYFDSKMVNLVRKKGNVPHISYIQTYSTSGNRLFKLSLLQGASQWLAQMIYWVGWMLINDINPWVSWAEEPLHGVPLIFAVGLSALKASIIFGFLYLLINSIIWLPEFLGRYSNQSERMFRWIFGNIVLDVSLILFIYLGF